MTDKIEELFAEYEKAFNALDVEKQASFFAEHFITQYEPFMQTITSNKAQTAQNTLRGKTGISSVYLCALGVLRG